MEDLARGLARLCLPASHAPSDQWLAEVLREAAGAADVVVVVVVE